MCVDYSVYPNGQCDKFIRCVGHRPIIMNCPINTLYNVVLRVCDWPYAVVCTSPAFRTIRTSRVVTDHITVPTSTTTTETSTATVDDGFRGVSDNGITDSGGGGGIHTRTTYWLVSSLLSSSAIPPVHVTTASPVTTMETFLTSKLSTEKDASIHCSDSIAWRPIADRASHCEYYYVCHFGQLLHVPCTPPLIFNAVYNICDKKENTVC
ncbi:uncharacterized protein LOC115230153 [Octopus sinensis]|uniref:Uncharacterized protein LOC115230153 n=1 Tax=Octopus sinensis TaxID=2607531 RepID=A0A6P7U5J6_9MOLL|nr:uncharacterized protein LOC115230153 [Octopus sinensis]XP_036355415.1 uncharacterized protein LOC115230153 [Octopus sinensis]